jgi:hypothetical protein
VATDLESLQLWIGRMYDDLVKEAEAEEAKGKNASP